jgi:AcrR family transcriptional regulator
MGATDSLIIGQTASPDDSHGGGGPIGRRIDTPWGPSDELRLRKLPPGPSNSSEVVERSQRERLFGAMVAVVSECGYETTRVKDILDTAGVSRSAFYKQLFPGGKKECFLATLDALLELARELILQADAGDGRWDERLAAIFDVVVRIVIAQPAAAKLWFVEIYAAGPEAVERIETLGDELEQLAASTLRGIPERSEMPHELIRAVIGGVRQIIQTRLRHDRQDELPDLIPDVLAWALSYRTPPRRLRRPRKPPRMRPSTPDAVEQRARIVAAVTEIITEKGYPAMTITEIAQRAAISLSTFYAHFENKPDVFLAAIDDGERQLLEATIPAYQAGTDWPHAVKDGLYAFFAFLTTNTATARLGGSDMFSGGPLALERHERSVQSFQALLAPGYQEHPIVRPIASEAIGSAIAALIYQQLRRKGAKRLYHVAPTATFLALAPFVGAERATAVANEGWHPKYR